MAKIENSTTPKVGVIMGSVSDWETMKEACDVLEQLQVAFEKKVVSAHRTPQWLTKYAEDAEGRGLQVIIAGAGGAAHLPGMVAIGLQLPSADFSTQSTSPIRPPKSINLVSIESASKQSDSAINVSFWLLYSLIIYDKNLVFDNSKFLNHNHHQTKTQP